MTAERTKDFDVLRADGHAIVVECLGMSPVDACAWVRDETAKAVRAEEREKLECRLVGERSARRIFREKGDPGSYVSDDLYLPAAVSALMADERVRLAQSRPPLSSSPVARAEVTEAVAKLTRERDAWREAKESLEKSYDAQARALAQVEDALEDAHKRIASLSSPDAAARVEEVIEFVRAWRGFEVDVAGQHGPSTGNALLRDLRAKFLPAPPAAPRSVTPRDELAEVFAWMEKHTDGARQLIDQWVDMQPTGPTMLALFREAMQEPPPAPSVTLACGDVVSTHIVRDDKRPSLLRRRRGDGYLMMSGYPITHPQNVMLSTDTIADLRAVESLASTLAGRDK